MGTNYDDDLLQSGSSEGRKPSSESPVESYKLVPTTNQLVEANFWGKNFELDPLNTQRLFDFTVEATADFIRKQKDGVTLVVPMMGSLPLVYELFLRLGKGDIGRGIDAYDLNKIDIRFAKKVIDADGKERYVFDDMETPVNENRVMLDDIIDQVGAFKEISLILGEISGNGNLVAFTPLVKTAGGTRGATKDLAKENGLSIAEIFPRQNEYAQINYAAVMPGVWVDTAFGMNSGVADILVQKKLDFEKLSIEEREKYYFQMNLLHNFLPGKHSDAEYLAELQTMERLLNVCIAGVPDDILENFEEYIHYLKNTFEASGGKKGPLFELMKDIELVHFYGGSMSSAKEADDKMRMARVFFVNLKSSVKPDSISIHDLELS